MSNVQEESVLHVQILEGYIHVCQICSSKDFFLMVSLNV